MADQPATPQKPLDAIPTITVKLKGSKKGAVGNINEGDFDPEKHERLSKKELADLAATHGSKEEAEEKEAAAAEHGKKR